MAILLPVIVFLLPLIITPGLLFHYDITPKVALLAIGVGIVLLRPREIELDISALWARRTGRWMCILAAAQTAWMGIASALSSRPWFSLLGANWRRMGLLTMLSLAVFTMLAAAHFCRRPAAIGTALRAFTIAGLFASAYGIAQYFDVDPLQPSAAYHAQSGDSVIVRPPGTLGHADYFGWWLAVVLFAALALERTGAGVWRWTARAAFVLCGIAILLSGTRSAMLGTAVGFACVSLVLRIRLRRNHIATAMAVTAVLAAFFFSPAGARMRARVQWSINEPAGGARPILWRDTLRMAAARPLTGFGPETFPAEFPRYQSTDLARLLPDFYYESPHNSALEALADQGAPGLLFAVLWVALGFAAAKDGMRANRSLAAFLAAGLAASCVAGMFGAMTLGPVFATAVLIAVLIAMPIAATPAQIEVASPPRLVWTLAVSAPLAVCLIAYGSALIVSDFALARFQSASSLYNDHGPNALTAWKTTAGYELPGASEDVFASRRLSGICRTIPYLTRQIDCWSLAADAARRATVTADNPPNAWYSFAVFAATQNDSASVEKALRTCEALAPNWFKPHWSLANFLDLTGRRQEAYTEAVRADLLDAGKDREVVETLGKLTN